MSDPVHLLCTLTNIAIPSGLYLRVMVHRSGKSENQMLAALPPEALARLHSALDRVRLRLGEAVYEAGVEMRHLYFPTDGIVSLLQVTEDGSSAEIAVVGNEGIVGIAMFMGGMSTLSRAVVQSEGHAYRLEDERLQSEFQRGGELQHLLLCYTQALIT